MTVLSCEVGSHKGERTLGGRQADPLGRAGRKILEALEQEAEKRAALVVAKGVDLIDDHRTDGAEHLSRPASR